MESLSKQELISTITKQSDQIKRYEARLRDVVAAYKGLAKEKEALEISLKALNKTDEKAECDVDSVAALTLSLSTLTAEKSRLEEAFQADKKVTRDKYEGIIASMKEETKNLVQQHLAEVNNLKTKIAYEIQEREKERADHTAMMKEFNMKFNAERKTKEKLEDKQMSNNDAQGTIAELSKRVRDLSAELDAARRRLARGEARDAHAPAPLVRLQGRLALLQQAHAVALREEQIKVKRAEEMARKVCAKQEERAAVLEGRLAELSATLGEYDARRRRDQLAIQQLKDALQHQIVNGVSDADHQLIEHQTQKSETDNDKLADSEYLKTLIDKIHIMKKELIAENEKLGNPIDVNTVFKTDGYENVHLRCREEFENLRLEYDNYKKTVKKESSFEINTDKEEIDKLNNDVRMLTEKVDSYKMLFDEEQQMKKETIKIYEEQLKKEQAHTKELITGMKVTIQSLEKQVETQRDRYATLLDETDNYMRARSDRARKVSRDDHHGLLQDVTSPPHMLHYAQELARKDLDISQLRKDKHIVEGQLRDSQRDSTIEKERFKEVIRTLKEEIDRLRRSQSREGANLEYLKNVVLSYLMSADYEGRRHMLNAIAAVLHFTDKEKNAVLSNI